MKKVKNIIIIFSILFVTISAFAHPTGNMISVGKNVLWSYIDPINDIEHHACIMIWRVGSQPEILIKSEFPASDYMLYKKEDYVYIIERRFIQSTETFQCRILKMKVAEKPVEIWSWFKDDWRVGEGGFFMPNDNQIVFARYPKVYCLEKGEEPVEHHFEVQKPINGLKAVENNQFLLTDDNTCWLVNQKGKILKTWNDLLEDKVENAPLNRNGIFDIDYYNGELLMAYWGKRSFETISNAGERKVICQLEQPYAPHWVAFLGNEKLLFSSKLIFNGSTPKPYLILLKGKNDKKIIWNEQ